MGSLTLEFVTCATCHGKGRLRGRGGEAEDCPTCEGEMTLPSDVRTDFKPEPTPKRPSKGLRRTAGFRRNPPLAAQFRFAVLHEFGGRCVMADRSACEGELEPAHILPKQTLRKLRLAETVVYDSRDGMALCTRHHARSDSGMERVPRELLPPSVEEFAKAHGLSYLLDKSYPSARHGGTR